MVQIVVKVGRFELAGLRTDEGQPGDVAAVGERAGARFGPEGPAREGGGPHLGGLHGVFGRPSEELAAMEIESIEGVVDELLGLELGRLQGEVLHTFHQEQHVKRLLITIADHYKNHCWLT